MIEHLNPAHLQGAVAIPPSKSDGQRALLCAALAEGFSVITNSGTDDDEQAMLENIKLLGAQIRDLDNNSLEIRGVSSLPYNLELNCGESGLGLRLLTCILSAFDGEKKITGTGSALKRRNAFFSQTLPQMGVTFTSNSDKVPFSITGKINPGEYSVDGSQSSQFISGLLMALPLLEGDSVLHINNLMSVPYVEMTLKTLGSFGIRIDREGSAYRIPGKQRYKSANYLVEGDWSSAGYWLVASAIGHRVVVRGLDSESLQADKEILKALDQANCNINYLSNGITVDGTNRQAFSFDATNCPDLFPSLTVLAAYCEGTSVITGVNRLKNKESDRGKALQDEFGKLGLTIELIDDQMYIYGTGSLRSGNVCSQNDHRIAMALAIAGTKIVDGITLDGSEVVSKSYPQFWEHLISVS